MKLNCILAGVGGQGTVLASKLIAGAAMEKGLPARTAETIGMAQRGGSVVSHVRIGEGVFSPLVPKKTADIIIGFEPGEAVRCLDYLKPGGVVVIADKAVRPVTDSLGKSSYHGEDMLRYLQETGGKVIVLSVDDVVRETGSEKTLNVALLGAAAESGVLGLTSEELAIALRRRLPEKFHQPNQNALDAGIRAAKKAGAQ